MLEKNIRIEEFCDMEQLYALIDNWSSSTGMSAVIIDAEGRRTSESFGMTPFCSMIHQTEKGMELCGGTWKCDLLGVYPAYINKMFEMVDIERLRDNWRTGFIGTMEYPVLYPGDVKYEWHEINVFAAVDDMGVRIVNILGRDVTDIHDIQEKNDRELKAAAEKNQILSEITRML